MHKFIDLERFPIDQPDSPEYAALVAQCQQALVDDGMFNLEGFLRPEICEAVTRSILPEMPEKSFRHARRHNIYFKKSIPGLDADHPALNELETVNHTMCGDQIDGSPLLQVYEYKPLSDFIARVMGKPTMYTMDDNMARVNVMAYEDGEALNWHFDRSEFTTTLLLQAPDQGGDFEFSTDLRSDTDPNYDGVAKLLTGHDPNLQLIRLSPGTLNVFRGKNTAHRVTPVKGDTARLITVFCYYETPGVRFSDEERLGFYGRVS